MKRLILILTLVISFGILNTSQKVHAGNVYVNINIGRQPAWGPTGYDYAQFYYLPEINCYYDVEAGYYYYPDRGRWVAVRYLPPYYSRYDFYSLYKVVINGMPSPWMYNRRHCHDYQRYVGYYNQPAIRYSNDARYVNSRRNKYDWVENGRELHNRPNRENSNGRSSLSAEQNRRTSNRYESTRTTRDANRQTTTSGRSSTSTRQQNTSRDAYAPSTTRQATSGRSASPSTSRDARVSSSRSESANSRYQTSGRTSSNSGRSAESTRGASTQR